MTKLFPPFIAPQRPSHPLEDRISELRALDRAYIAEEIELTKKGARIEAPASADKTELRALQILSDMIPAEPAQKTKPKSKSGDPNLRLVWLVAERSATLRAVEIASQRLYEARLEQVRQFLSTSLAKRNENVRETALTLCKLWALNRDRETIDIMSGGSGSRPCNMHHKLLFGLGAPGEIQSANAKLFIQEALDEGIVTEREVQKILGA